MKIGDKIIYTNRIGQAKKATIINILHNEKILLTTDDEQDKVYTANKQRCKKI